MVTNVRVLIISHGHPDFRPGGGEMAAYQQFTEFRERGIEATFLAASNHDRLFHGATPFVMHRKNEILLQAQMQDYFMLRPASLRPLTHDLKLLLDNLQPDVIHFHHLIHIGMHALHAVEAYRRRVSKPVRVVFTIHEYILICGNNGQMIRADTDELCSEASPTRCGTCVNRPPEDVFLREAFFRTGLRSVDHFISPSKFLKDRFETWGLPAPITYIENGQEKVDKLLPRPLQEGEKRIRIAYLGQINKFKGLDVLLNALQFLPPDLRKKIVINVHGSGLEGQPQELRDSINAARKRFKKNIFLHGRYRRDDLPGILQVNDTVVMPSIWWENSPLVIQESLKFGRPMIVSNIGGMREKVRDGIDGLHFIRGSSADLATKLERMADPETWQSFYDGLPVPLTIEESAAETLALYQGLFHAQD